MNAPASDEPDEGALDEVEESGLAFQLASGRRVWIDALYVDITYAGLLAGLPTPELNRECVDEALQKAGKLFHGDPYLLTPGIRTGPRGEPLLPPVRYIAELGSAAVEADQDASRLVVVWFGPVPGRRPLPEIFQDAWASLEWEEHSRDFQL